MAWTAPRTWVTAEQVTASHMNTHVRDNFLETAPAKATAAGRIIVTTGNKSVEERQFSQATVTTSETTAATSFTDLATSGPAVTVTTGANALVIVTCEMSNGGAGNECFMDFGVSGAHARSAGTGTAVKITSNAADDRYAVSRPFLQQSITGGSNTFTAKYRVSAGTGTFLNRRILVLPL